MKHLAPLVAVLGICLACRVFGADQEIQIRLEADREQYRVGDTIRFRITYTNVSEKTVALLPQIEAYPAKMFEMERVGDATKPSHIPAAGELSIAWEGVAEHVTRLSQNKHTTIVITADVESHLPDFYDDTTAGRYLVFSGSALRLPGPGKYQIQVRFNSPRDHPVNRYVGKAKTLWVGEARSNKIAIQVR